VTHMQITWYCLYIISVEQHFQRSTIVYLSNSWASSVSLKSARILSLCKIFIIQFSFTAAQNL